jgi:hypothetical protein
LVFYAEVAGLFGSETRFLIPIYIVKRPHKEVEIDPKLLPNKEPEYFQQKQVPQFNPEDYQIPTMEQEEQHETGKSNPYLQGQEQQLNQNLYPSFETSSHVQDIPLGFQINQQTVDYSNYPVPQQNYNNSQQYQTNQYQTNQPYYSMPQQQEYEDVQYDLPPLPSKTLPPPITEDIIQDQINSSVMNELNQKLNQEKKYEEFFEN